MLSWRCVSRSRWSGSMNRLGLSMFSSGLGLSTSRQNVHATFTKASYQFFSSLKRGNFCTKCVQNSKQPNHERKITVRWAGSSPAACLPHSHELQHVEHAVNLVRTENSREFLPQLAPCFVAQVTGIRIAFLDIQIVLRYEAGRPPPPEAG